MSVKLALNILLGVGIAATVAGGALMLLRESGSPDGVEIALDETAAPTEAPPAESIAIYITGAVKRAGVYELPPGARLNDALLAAGGPTSVADLETLNLARRLSDEERVRVPTLSESGAAGANAANVPAPPPDSAPRGRLDINTAPAEDLAALPNIGPSRAAAIVAHREREGAFASVEDLRNVSGIGERILDSIRDLVEVR